MSVTFSAYGLAGARIDRIATAAAANKRSIYVYFGSKEKLFDAALHHVLTRMIEDVPLTEDDLPGYAGRLFDYHLVRPEGLPHERLAPTGAGPRQVPMRGDITRSRSPRWPDSDAAHGKLFTVFCRALRRRESSRSC